MNEVYYKLYRSSRTELITIVCMQWFDEFDYHEERFVRDSTGYIHSFDTEEEAKIKLNEWYKSSQIDPEYLIYSPKENDLIRD